MLQIIAEAHYGLFNVDAL